MEALLPLQEQQREWAQLVARGVGEEATGAEQQAAEGWALQPLGFLTREAGGRRRPWSGLAARAAKGDGPEQEQAGRENRRPRWAGLTGPRGGGLSPREAVG